MTAFEFEELIQLAQKWWPGLSWVLDQDTYRPFKQVPVEDGRKAIEQLVGSCEKYPSLALLLKTAKQVAAPIPQPQKHVWSLLGEDEQQYLREHNGKPDSSHIEICVLCGQEKWVETGDRTEHDIE
ncbi:MAG: hypothetical protein WC977_09100 [Anaerovoracaceae bacterium]|jgi:hypothetical protein